jgi:RHS repeat-associated protein
VDATQVGTGALARVRRDPFGNAVTLAGSGIDPRISAAAPGANPSGSAVTVGYTGHEQEDELGFINMSGRIMDPRVGRFLQADPIVGGVGQSMNRYSYVMNNPLRYTDPSGFEWTAEDEAHANFQFDVAQQIARELDREQNGDTLLTHWNNMIERDAEASAAVFFAAARARNAQREAEAEAAAAAKAAKQGQANAPAQNAILIRAKVAAYQAKPSCNNNCSDLSAVPGPGHRSAIETQEILRSAARELANMGYLTALNAARVNIGGGKWDFATTGSLNTTYTVNGSTLDAAQFGNYFAGYVTGGRFGSVGVALTLAAGELYHRVEQAGGDPWIDKELIRRGAYDAEVR